MKTHLHYIFSGLKIGGFILNDGLGKVICLSSLCMVHGGFEHPALVLHYSMEV